MALDGKITWRHPTVPKTAGCGSSYTFAAQFRLPFGSIATAFPHPHEQIKMRTDMNFIDTNGRTGLRRRDGLTVLEFVGCTIAIVGGMWLGVSYFGIDVRHVAHLALTEAQLMDKVPPSWRPPGPNDGMTRQQLVATLREELSTLRNEIAALRDDGRSSAGENSNAENVDDARPTAAEDSNTTPLTMEKTRAYWQRLSEIAVNEATLQREADASFKTENAAQVFAIKARVSRVAAKAVHALKADNVDQAAVGFAQDLAAWYEHGGELYDRAVQIWEMPTQGRAHFNEEWTRADLQHRNESQLLNEKAAATRGTLSRQYNVEFPPFGEGGADGELPQKGPNGDDAHPEGH